jgi:hypothetical protein
MTPEAEELREYMSELSEEAWRAGWMTNLEYDLWSVVQDGPAKYGWLALDAERIAKLRRLAASCGGWIIFDDEAGETWVPAAEWDLLYAAWKKGGA